MIFLLIKFLVKIKIKLIRNIELINESMYCLINNIFLFLKLNGTSIFVILYPERLIAIFYKNICDGRFFRLYQTVSYALDKRNGAGRWDWYCCCHTVWKPRGQNIRPPDWRDFFNYATTSVLTCPERTPLTPSMILSSKL